MSVNPHALSPEFLALPCRRFFDLPYADQSPSQVLDLWLPAEDGEKPFPLIIHIHGGAFLFGEKREKPVEPAPMRTVLPLTDSAVTFSSST